MRHMHRQCATNTASLPTIALGLLGGLVGACLLTWRLSITWEMGQVMVQVSLFALGWSLLKQDSLHYGSAEKLGSTLGVMFITLWLATCSRLAFSSSPPLQEYASLFEHTAFTYIMFGAYAVECGFMMVLLHKLVPSWLCNLLGVVRSLLHTHMLYRYASTDKLSAWRVTSLLFMPQFFMFLPYYLCSYWLHRHSRPPSDHPMHTSSSSPAQPANTASLIAEQLHAGQISEDASSGTTSTVASACSTFCSSSTASLCCLRDAHAASTVNQNCMPSANVHSQPLGTWLSPAASDKRRSQPSKGQPRKADADATHDSMAASEAIARFSPAAQAIMDAPYTSQLRVSHAVCVKLDTQQHYSRLPPDMAQSLQSALRTSILKVEELLSAAQPELCTAGVLPEDLVHAWLPALQSMLSTIRDPASVQRAVLQLDDELVTCVWRDDKQAWDVQLQLTADHKQPQTGKPWLGIATASALRPATMATLIGSDSTAHSTFGLLEVLVEVQLWGVSKVADVEGWTPPQQHQDGNIQWPGGRQQSASKAPMKLLARRAGGYLPTEVLRLMPGRSDGYVTAQVLVQLHEHQLTRHHEGGAPSTLLLMDLELWQNEVLLSSSPLLSVPSTGATADGAITSSAWWWGAADKTVAAALAELDSFARGCLTITSQDRAVAIIRTYVKYTEDLAIWLLQVQRVAYASQLCRFAQAAVHSKPIPAGTFHQPLQQPATLKQLGHELVGYAKYTGWENLHRMLSQQVRSVVLKADPKLLAQQAQFQPQTSTWQAAKAVLFGYPCRHDEQLYKQHLADQLSGVVVIASTVAVLIGVALTARALAVGEPLRACVLLFWCILQLAALVCMLLGRAQRQQGLPHNASLRLAYWFTMVAYVFRASCNILFALSLKPAYRHFYMWAFQKPALWAAVKLVTMLSDQVPASIVLPASCVTCMAVLLEFPALLVDVLRGSRWHPAVSVVATFFLAVGVRVLLGTQLRKQLTPLTTRAYARRQAQADGIRWKQE